MNKPKIALSVLLALGASIAGARLLFPLPSLAGRTAGDAAVAAPSGTLAQRLNAEIAAHPGKSGLHAMPDAAAAFAARILLARAAEHTIDTQYYIWHDDLTGLLLLDELRSAARRGVKVRLLLDDNGIANLDSILSQLSAQPNFEIRLYNPFTVRGFKQAGYAFDFWRLNRRMHNKSFTADGTVTIGGGRNVGDEYFGTGIHPTFVDLDLLATGAVVADVSADFARYWNSRSAYPLNLIVDPAPNSPDLLAEALARVSKGPQQSAYAQEIVQNRTVRALADGTLPLEWTQAILVSDPPSKTFGEADEKQLLVGQISDLLGLIEHQLDIISPYFVPGKKGTDQLIALAQGGIRVRVLTNSLDANDVMPVHAGYAKYRRRLLEGGVELYELKSTAAAGSKKSDAGLAGSSAASLHAKSFAVDGRRIYIGSFNFDPRSVHLNTEMGMMVDSERMAQDMHRRFGEEIGAMAYAVTLGANGEMEWREERDGFVGTIHHEEPNSSFAERAAVRAVGWLPVQWLL